MRDQNVIRVFAAKLGMHLDVAKLIWRRYLNVRDRVYLAYALGHLKIQMKPRMIKTALYNLHDPGFADFLVRIGCWSYPWVKRRVSDMLEPIALLSSINALITWRDKQFFRYENTHLKTFITEFLEWSIVGQHWYYFEKLCKMIPMNIIECTLQGRWDLLSDAQWLMQHGLPMGLDLDPDGKLLLGDKYSYNDLLRLRIKLSPGVIETLREKGDSCKVWRLREYYGINIERRVDEAGCQ